MDFDEKSLSSFGGRVLPQGGRLTESSYTSNSSRSCELIASDVEKFQVVTSKKTEWIRSSKWAVAFAIIKVGIDFVLVQALKIKAAYINFSESEPISFYGGLLANFIISFSVFALTLNVSFQMLRRKIYRRHYEIDGDPVSFLNENEGDFVYSVGNNGVALEGNGITMTVQWDRVESIYAETEFDGLYIFDKLREMDNGDPDETQYKQFTFLQDYKNKNINKVNLDENQEVVGVIRVRLKREDSATAFEEIAIPKRAFYNMDKERSWLAFFLDAQSYFAAHRVLNSDFLRRLFQ